MEDELDTFLSNLEDLDIKLQRASSVEMPETTPPSVFDELFEPLSPLPDDLSDNKPTLDDSTPDAVSDDKPVGRPKKVQIRRPKKMQHDDESTPEQRKATKPAKLLCPVKRKKMPEASPGSPIKRRKMPPKASRESPIESKKMPEASPCSPAELCPIERKKIPEPSPESPARTSNIESFFDERLDYSPESIKDDDDSVPLAPASPRYEPTSPSPPASPRYEPTSPPTDPRIKKRKHSPIRAPSTPRLLQIPKFTLQRRPEQQQQQRNFVPKTFRRRVPPPNQKGLFRLSNKRYLLQTTVHVLALRPGMFVVSDGFKTCMFRGDNYQKVLENELLNRSFCMKELACVDPYSRQLFKKELETYPENHPVRQKNGHKMDIRIDEKPCPWCKIPDCLIRLAIGVGVQSLFNYPVEVPEH